jgi:hypothetical protein
LAAALRFFAESRNLALRHELIAVARLVVAEAPLDLDRLVADWDHGRYLAAADHRAARTIDITTGEEIAAWTLPAFKKITPCTLVLTAVI